MARLRFQEGSLEKKSGKWRLRWREYDPSGEAVPKSKSLCTVQDFPTETEVRRNFSQQIDKLIGSQSQAGPADYGLTLEQFIEQRYYARLDQRLQIPANNELHIERSTVDGYKDIFKCHVQGKPLAQRRVRDITPNDVQAFVEALPQHLSHRTHLRIRNFLSGVFSWAVNQSLIMVNPVATVKAGGQRKQTTKGLDARRLKIQASNNHAYGLDEVADFLHQLPNPAKTVCAVAGFTGLTHSELRGLKWTDYDGNEIKVSRKVIDSRDYDGEGALKTEAREGAIPVIPQLRQILDEYKEEFPPNEQDWVFRGEKFGDPLNLSMISQGVIDTVMPGAWHGWHAFRRGLGTRLSDLGVDAKVIQAILRHANVSTTQAYYILPDKTRAEAGMAKLSKVLAKHLKPRHSRRARRFATTRRSRIL